MPVVIPHLTETWVTMAKSEVCQSGKMHWDFIHVSVHISEHSLPWTV